MADFESVQAALYDRLKAYLVPAGIKFTARKFLDFDKVPAQPAMLVVALRGTGTRQLGALTKWTKHVAVVFYAKTTDDSKTTIETQFNGYLKLIDGDDDSKALGALQRQPNELGPEDDPGTSLDGKVFRCWRTNEQIFHGSDEVKGQAVLVLEIEMTLPE